MTRPTEAVPFAPVLAQIHASQEPANDGTTSAERPSRPFRLALVGLNRHIGVERTTFAIEMLSPVLAGLARDEFLSIDIEKGTDGHAVSAAIGGLVRAEHAADLSLRATDTVRLLENIVRVQMPGFRLRRTEQGAAAAFSQQIVPRGRTLALETRGDKPVGPASIKPVGAPLLLPPLDLAPERLMAAAQIVASSRTPMALSLRLRLVPLDAKMLRRLIDARRATERWDPITHMEALRQMTETLPDHKYISALIDEGQAVELTMLASGAAPIDGTTTRTLCHALFATPPADPTVSGLEGDDLELVTLYPRGFVLPHLVAGLALTAAFSFQRPPALYEGANGPGVLLGHAKHQQAVVIGDRDRALHTFAIGATGTGKSTLLLNQMIADMEAGKGLILVDPHGDLWEQAMQAVPASRRGDLIAGHLGDPERSFSMNVLAGLGGDPGIERSMTVNGLLRLFTRTLWSGIPEAFGPIFELYFRNAMLLLMEGQGDEATFLDFERVFQDEEFRDKLLERCKTQNVKDFWLKTVAHITYNDWSLENLNPYITSKFSPFTTNALLRPVLGSSTSSLDLQAAIAGGKIVLLNLAKGLVGEGSARLVGALVTMRLVAAAQTQMKLPAAERKAFVAYLDEFQTYATEHIGEAIEETRKYRLSLVLACQSLGQIDGRGHNADVGRSIIANVANLIAFRLGVEDAAILAKWFEPDFSVDDLLYLPNYTAVSRLMVDGQALRPIEFRAAPPRVALR